MVASFFSWRQSKNFPLEIFVSAAFCLFLCLFIVFGEAVNKLFYVFLFLAVICAVKNYKELLFFLRERPISLFFCFLGLYVISMLWGDARSYFPQYLKYVGYVSFFYLFTAYLQMKKPHLLVLTVGVGTLASLLVCIGYYYISGEKGGRMSSPFSPNNVIDLSGYFFMGSLCWLFWALEQPKKSLMLLFFLSSALLAMGGVMTGSRLPFFAYFLVLFLCLPRSRKTFLFVFFVVSICFLAAWQFSLWNRMGEGIIDGKPIRFFIWERALTLFLEEPILGHGYLTSFFQDFPSTGEHFYTTHSIYMGILYSCGLVGLILFLALVFFTVRPRFNFWKRCESYVTTILPFSLSLFSLIFISGQGMNLLSHPRQIWILFWLPLGMCLGSFLENGKNHSHVEKNVASFS